MFKKWSSLNQFHEVIKNLNYPRIYNFLAERKYVIPYGFKIKLHGTNACVRIEPDGNVVPQKRTSDIVDIQKFGGVIPFKDNAGFANWVLAHEDKWIHLADSSKTIYIYGEWCGPKVQDGVAVSMTERKFFYVFAIDTVEGDKLVRHYCPDKINEMIFKNGFEHDDVMVIPWHMNVDLSFIDKSKTESSLQTINEVVEQIGIEDPFIKETFEISGAGEGLVAYPLLGLNAGKSYESDELDIFGWFNFKAKCEAHRVNKQKTAAKFDASKYAGVQMFADAYCTEARFVQAYKEGLGEEKDLRRIPDFIKWVVTDIHKEAKVELEANPELDWKTISKACSSRAVSWYKDKVKEV